MFDLPQFHLLPSAACSSSRLLPTTSATRTLWSPTLRATSPLLHPHLMLLLGARQGNHTSLLAQPQHLPSALEIEPAASTHMAASPLRSINKLFIDLQQFHSSPNAATSSSRLLWTTSAICALWSPTLHAIAIGTPLLRMLLITLPQPRTVRTGTANHQGPSTALSGHGPGPTGEPDFLPRDHTLEDGGAERGNYVV